MMFSQLKKIAMFLVFLLLVAFLVVVFSGIIISNPQTVVVSFWGWSSPSISLSMALFASFWLGCCLTVVAALIMALRLSFHSKSLERKVVRRERELQTLRVSALRGLSS